MQIIGATNYRTILKKYAIWGVGGAGQNCDAEILKMAKKYTYYCTIFGFNYCTAFLSLNFPKDLKE